MEEVEEEAVAAAIPVPPAAPTPVGGNVHRESTPALGFVCTALTELAVERPDVLSAVQRSPYSCSRSRSGCSLLSSSS